MVAKLLTGGTGGNLNTSGDNFGVDDDLISVAYEQRVAYTYSIYTLAGNDLIDLQDANALNFHVVYSGAGRDTIQGGNAAEFVYDQSGNDQIVLRGGSDVYISGRGNDIANGGGGVDVVYFYLIYDDEGVVASNSIGITCDLAKTGVQNFGVFGKDRISGFENVEGSYGADRLSGTGGVNSLTGSAGKDVLNGRGGADTFDLNDGSTARDLVVYTRISDSGTGLSAASIDVIKNFDRGGLATDDKIDLRAIDANPHLAGNQAFLFRGTNGFSSPGGEVRTVLFGSGTLVQVDIDGDGASEMNILVKDVTGLTAADFFL